MLTGTAIETAAYQSLVRGNAIGEGITGAKLPGGATGVFLPDQCNGCALVYGNSIADASDYGIWVEGSRNQVYGNDIEQSGQAGIYFERPGIFGGAWHNVIGGDETSEENTISGSAGPAIEIVEASEYGNTRRNEVLRNNGSSNAGPFIALVGAANGGIEPPVLASSTASGASGTAAAGATIRVFRKADSSSGEIEGFLAETVADGAGDWAVAYQSSIQAGTIIAASQTTEEDGTSEFAFATTTAPPSEEEKGDGNSGQVEGNPGPTPDRTAPETMIVKGPKPSSRSRTARFEFSASEPSSFRCKLDRRPVSSCRSPRVYRHLKAGRHVFEVWAIDAAGNPDASPAKRVFWVRGK
jgi:hypothetical protein